MTKAQMVEQLKTLLPISSVTEAERYVTHAEALYDALQGHEREEAIIRLALALSWHDKGT